MPKVPKVTKSQNLGKKEVRHKFNILLEGKSQSFLEADTMVLVVIIRYAQSTQNNRSLEYFCKISRKKGGTKLIFCIEISKPFYKLIPSVLLSMASLVQSIWNNKFTKSLQYLEKEVRDKVDFCRDKLKSIQKVGTVISDGCSQAYLKYSKKQSCNIFAMPQESSGRWSWFFSRW